MLWNVFGSTFNQLMGFAMGIILARMIAPEAYGLIAMAMVFIGVTGVFIDGGFGAALIRKKEATDRDYNTVFWYNLLAAVLIFLLLFITAPLISRFFEQPELVKVIRWLGLNLIIGALTVIQGVQLTKKLDFKALNIISLIATIFSGILGVTLAFRGFGVWALIVQHLSSTCFRTILIFFHNRWIPALVFCKNSFKEMFSFGNKLLASALLDAIFRNLYPLVIGRFFSPASLAFYTRADSYQKLLSQNLSRIVQGVSFPALVPLQDDNERLKNAYRQMIRMVMLVNAPAMLGLLVVSEPAIVFLITEKWLPSVPYLQWLCLAGLLYPLHAINLNVINVKGRSDIFLKLEIAKKAMVGLAIVGGIPWGIKGLVIGQVITSFLAYFLNAFFSLRLIKYSIREQVKDVLPFVGLSALMGLMVWLTGFLFWGEDLMQSEIIGNGQAFGGVLLLQIMIGIGVYGLGSAIFKFAAFEQLLGLLKQVLLKK